MPELDIFFVEFPAEKHLAAVAEMREIHQAAFEILELDAEFFDGAQLSVHLSEIHQQAVNDRAAEVGVGIVEQFSEFLIRAQRELAPSLSIANHLAEAGKECASFREGEMLLEMHGCNWNLVRGDYVAAKNISSITNSRLFFSRSPSETCARAGWRT